MEPRLRGHPAEYFGHPYTIHSAIVEEKRQRQHRPFLDEECKKPRKSQPEIKIGICTVGYKTAFLPSHTPVIICPYRFNIDPVYRAIEREYISHIDPNNLIWVPEVSLGAAGSVDFAVVRESNLRDFLCVEFQAAGTTGTPWEAVQEYKRTGGFSKDRYNYGINWANEFTKTMMQQAYKKGILIEMWHRRIVFAMQDVGMRYLQETNDTSGLHEQRNDDPIHFCVFQMVWNDGDQHWGLVLNRKLSTNAEGIRKMLSGSPEDVWPTENEVIENIRRKMQAENLSARSQRSLNTF